MPLVILQYLYSLQIKGDSQKNKNYIGSEVFYLVRLEATLRGTLRENPKIHCLGV
jgi:hypothetical protein